MTHAFAEHERYELGERLGEGGMGVVFRATDRELGREIALKVMRVPDAASVELLKAEFRARVRLHHPNLLPLLDLEVGGGHAFFTMDLIEGVDLGTWFRAEAARLPFSTLGLGTTLRAIATTALVPTSEPRPVAARLEELPGVVCQLISALDALHQAGLVHRDVKPQNVLIDVSGKLLLADFGLTTTFRERPGSAQSRTIIAGTPGYMAPELLRGERATPACDAYAVGATLFHLLAGRPPALGEYAANVLPATWNPWPGLIDDMLNPRPAPRLKLRTAHERIAALCDDRPLSMGTRHRWMSLAELPFVGRDDELARLTQWAREALQFDAATLVRVTGPSGIGKSAIVEALVHALEHDRLVVLRGRCHPREHVAFGGFDSVVAELSERLDASAELVSVDEASRAALTTVFPAFSQVRHLRGKSSERRDVAERRVAFATLRHIVEALARDLHVVLLLEDLHWIAGDSRELFTALMRKGGPARLLVIATHRDIDTFDGSDASIALDAFEGRSHLLELGALAKRETRALLEQLTGTKAIDDEVVDATGGHPILVREVARQLEHDDGVEREGTLRLQDLINGSIEQLDGAERRLLDLLAVSPWPVPPGVAIRSLPKTAQPSVLVTLQQLGFVRWVGQNERRLLPYHDQIQTARRAVMSTEVERSLHRALAAAYEASGPDALEQRSHHHHGAGDLERAGTCAMAAARRAAQQMAFRRAATFYEHATAWLPAGSRDPTLQADLGDMRAKAGFAAAAGEAFERAAQHGAGASAETHLTRAAEQFLHGGRVLDGYRLLRTSFKHYGVELPRSHRACLAMSLGLRARLVASDPWARRDVLEGSDDPWLTRKLDALWMATNGLIHINHALADVMLLLHIREAKRLNDPSRVIRSITLEAGAEATVGGRFFNLRAHRLLAQAQRLLETSPTAFDRGWLAVGRGAVACFQGDWRAAARWSASAERELSNQELGAAFERTVNNIYRLTSLAHLGRLDELAETQALALDDARERGDEFALNVCRSSHAALTWLIRGDLHTAREHARALVGIERLRMGTDPPARWPEGTFRTSGYHNLVALTHLDLYTCDADTGVRAHPAPLAADTRGDAVAGAIRQRRSAVPPSQVCASRVAPTRPARQRPGPPRRAQAGKATRSGRSPHGASLCGGRAPRMRPVANGEGAVRAGAPLRRAWHAAPRGERTPANFVGHTRASRAASHRSQGAGAAHARPRTRHRLTDAT